MVGNSRRWRLCVTAPLMHRHSRLPGVRNSPTLPFEAKNLTSHLFDTVDRHVGTSSWSFFARDHYRIKRNQRRKMHRHMGRPMVVLVFCQAAVLSSTTGTTRYLRVPRILQCRGGPILMWAEENPNDLVSWARLWRVAELRASAVPPHHRHLPADPALNRYVVTLTRQTLPLPHPPSQAAAAPSPLFARTIYWLTKHLWFHSFKWTHLLYLLLLS